MVKQLIVFFALFEEKFPVLLAEFIGILYTVLSFYNAASTERFRTHVMIISGWEKNDIFAFSRKVFGEGAFVGLFLISLY